MKTIPAILLGGSLLYGAGAQAALVTIFGKDTSGSSTVPLALTPKATAAQAQFLSALNNPQVETFESIAPGTINPILNFGSRTAQLSGGNSSVVSVAPGQTDGDGRYSIPAGSSGYYNVNPNSGNRDFTLTFSEEVAAFGFFGIDIGDYGGSLSLDFYDEFAQLVQSIAVPGNRSSVNNGSVLYFGVIADTPADYFKTVTFHNAGIGDGFAFDNFTIADPSQVTAIPEPGSLALAGLGLVGLFAMRAKKIG